MMKLREERRTLTADSLRLAAPTDAVPEYAGAVSREPMALRGALAHELPG